MANEQAIVFFNEIIASAQSTIEKAKNAINALSTSSPLQKVAGIYSKVVGATDGEAIRINSFVSNAEAHGYDDLMIAVYTFMGGSLRQKMLNMMCPEDLNEAYRAVPLSSIINDPNGIKIMSANINVLDTTVFPDDLVGAPNLMFAYYVQSPCAQLLRNDDATLSIIHRASDGKSYPNIGKSSPGVPFTGNNEAGLIIVQRTDFDTVEVWMNGTLRAVDKRHIDKITSPDTTATYFPDTSIKFYSSNVQVVSFFMVGRPMTKTQIADFTNDVKQLVSI